MLCLIFKTSATIERQPRCGPAINMLSRLRSIFRTRTEGRAFRWLPPSQSFKASASGARLPFAREAQFTARRPPFNILILLAFVERD